MSFESIKEREDKIIHERACVLLYNFTANEIRQLQNIARLTGIREAVILKPENGDQTIRNILDGEVTNSCTDAAKDKAILFNGIAGSRISMFIETLKKYRIKRPLVALVTEQSIEWELKVVLENLIDERNALAQNKLSSHN